MEVCSFVENDCRGIGLGVMTVKPVSNKKNPSLLIPCLIALAMSRQKKRRSDLRRFEVFLKLLSFYFERVTVRFIGMDDVFIQRVRIL